MRHSATRDLAVAETVGWLADKLSIVELKIYHMQEQADRADATAEFRERCHGRLEVLRMQRDDLAAELVHGDFERRSRAERRLLEQQRDVPSVEDIRGRREPSERPIRFDLRGEVQAAFEIRGIEHRDLHGLTRRGERRGDKRGTGTNAISLSCK